jgi:hypothetical protein
MDQLHGTGPQGRASHGGHCAARAWSTSAGEWFYEEYARNAGVSSLGLESRRSGLDPLKPQRPKSATSILDLFRN